MDVGAIFRVAIFRVEMGFYTGSIVWALPESPYRASAKLRPRATNQRFQRLRHTIILLTIEIVHYLIY